MKYPYNLHQSRSRLHIPQEGNFQLGLGQCKQGTETQKAELICLVREWGWEGGCSDGGEGVGRRRGVERGGGDLVAGFEERGDCLDVGPVPVRFEYSLNAQCVAEFEELFVFVGSIEQYPLAGGLAADDEHVVLVGPDDDLVHFGVGV